jgi:hypothetical protein
MREIATGVCILIRPAAETNCAHSLSVSKRLQEK